MNIQKCRFIQSMTKILETAHNECILHRTTSFISVLSMDTPILINESRHQQMY